MPEDEDKHTETRAPNIFRRIRKPASRIPGSTDEQSDRRRDLL